LCYITINIYDNQVVWKGVKHELSGIKAIMLHFDALEEYAGLTDEQFGRLIRAGLLFGRDDKETELGPPESYLFPGLKLKIERDKEQYSRKCEQNRENVNKRWERQREEIRPYTTEYESYQQKEKEQSQQEKQSQTQQQEQQQEQAKEQLRKQGFTDAEIDQAIRTIKNPEEIRNLTGYLRQKLIGERMKPQTQNYQQRDYSDREKALLKRFIEMGQDDCEQCETQGEPGRTGTV
jgi:flagellar biosynthesis GTPase FlhF